MSTRHPYLLIATLMVAELVTIFEGSMIYAAMGSFYATFGDPITVGWTLTAYLLVSASTAVVSGRLADMYGRRRVLFALLGFSVLGSLISALAGDVVMVIVGRALQGLTGAILPVSYGLMRQHLSQDHARMGIGIVSAVLTVGGAIGVFVGGLIVDLLSWRWIFIFSAVVSVIAGLMVLVFVPAQRHEVNDSKIDVVGALLFMLPMTAVMFAISSAWDWGWTDGRAVGLIGLSVVVLALWIVYELRHTDPLVDVRMLGKRQPLLANLSMMMIGLGPLQAKAFVMLLLQQPETVGPGLGLSASLAGLLMFIPFSMGIIGGPAAAYASKRSSPRHTLLLGTSLIAAAWIAVAAHHSSVAFIFVMMMAVGMGQAMAMAAVPMLILEAVPAERTSEATSIITSLRPAAMGMGVQISSYFIALYTIPGAVGASVASYPSDQAFTLTYGFVAAAATASLLIALLLPRPSGRGGDAA